MPSSMLVVGLSSVACGLLVLTLGVVSAGRGRVPLARLDPEVAPQASALAGAGAAASAAVARVLVKRGRMPRGAAALEKAGFTMTLPDVVLVVGILSVVAGAVGTVLAGIPAGLLAAAVVLVGTRLLVRLRTGRRQAAFADQLDDSLQLMASSLRAGHSMLRAMDAVAQEAEAPTSDEFARLINETRVGRDLTEALDDISERTASEDFSWVAQAIAIQREVGGNLAEVLDQVGHTIRERNAIRRQVKALSAEGKLSAVVLMALPFGIIGFISMTNPSYLSAFTESPVGFGMAAVASVMMVIGAVWLKSTVRIRF